MGEVSQTRLRNQWTSPKVIATSTATFAPGRSSGPQARQAPCKSQASTTLLAVSSSVSVLHMSSTSVLRAAARTQRSSPLLRRTYIPCSSAPSSRPTSTLPAASGTLCMKSLRERCAGQRTFSVATVRRSGPHEEETFDEFTARCVLFNGQCSATCRHCREMVSPCLSIDATGSLLTMGATDMKRNSRV